MDEETRLAEELKARIQALVKEYGQHEHLTAFTSTLEEVVEEIDACIEDVEEVE